MYKALKLYTDVSAADEGRFIELPFTVPPRVREIQFKVKVTPNQSRPCIIDLGVCDPTQVRGWSGSTKYDLRIGLDFATPGYLKGDIQPGEWYVLLGAYVVGAAGARVDVDITFIESEPEWLQGDLHLHTVHSDGAYTLAELDSLVRSVGLDFVALTDHNTVSQNFCYPQESSVVYIPAMELTTYHGHANLLGVPIPCDDFRVQSSADVVRLLELAKQSGASITLNHPYDDAGPSCQWQWGYEVPFDWLEIWNGPWRASNVQSLALWQNMLCTGKRIIALGGSDTHRVNPPYQRHGYPTNYVYTISRRVDDILAAMHAGHVSLSYRPGGPRIELTSGEVMMGDVTTDMNPVQVKITGVESQDVVVIVTEAGEIERHIVTAPGTWMLEIEHQHKWFVRAELWRHFAEANDMLLAAISNPLFFVES